MARKAVTIEQPRRQALDVPADLVSDEDAFDPTIGMTSTQLAARALMRRAEHARSDLTEFYRFVIRHEITKKPLDPAAHQCLLFSFIQHHDRTVVRMPIGTSKTFSMAAFTLFLLGKDVTQRGGMISKTRTQAAKVLAMVSSYIEDPILSARLNLVFPWLTKSTNQTDPWTQYQITVDRPPGIRDASLAAIGVDGAILGARLSWLVADDTIDDENSNTPEVRDKTNGRFDGRLLSRLDPFGSRAVVTNTPWNNEDLTYHLERDSGWPSITMDIYGFVTIVNADAAWMVDAEQTLIRPSTTRPGKWRLRAHDPDPDEQTPLWAERYPLSLIQSIRYGKNGAGGIAPHEFARQFLCEPFDADAARCHRDWIERCKRLGIGTQMQFRYDGTEPVYCGIDLAIGSGKQHDKSVFFVYEQLARGVRRILWVESGRWSGKEVVDKIADFHKRYGCIFGVENNFGQDFLRQWAIDKHADIVIKAHRTGGDNKRNLDFGVESLFTELQNGAWIIPCEHDGRVHPEIQLLIDGCLHYNPRDHASDHLMAMWIGRERGRKGGAQGAPHKPGRAFELVRQGGGF